tara:strand:- start:14706 stop:14918 length:213 start_codon:yes stop_codon:yes gene_type:complete
MCQSPPAIQHVLQGHPLPALTLSALHIGAKLQIIRGKILYSRPKYRAAHRQQSAQYFIGCRFSGMPAIRF